MYTFPCGPGLRGCVVPGDFTGGAAILCTAWATLPRVHFTHWGQIQYHHGYPWFKGAFGFHGVDLHGNHASLCSRSMALGSQLVAEGWGPCLG